MALPLIATVAELQARTGETYTGTEQARAEAVLADASDLARFEASALWVDETGAVSTAPAPAKVIVLKAARRAMENPDGFTVEADGSYRYGRNEDDTSDWVYFTEDERRVLAALGGTHNRGLSTISTTRGLRDADAYASARSTYVFPWFTTEDGCC